MDKGASEILICQIEGPVELLVGEKVPHGPPTTAEQGVLSPTKRTEERENKKSCSFWGKKDN